MNMPVTNEASFKQRIGFLKEALEKEGNEIATNLNEKGVECSILIPLLEHILGFDALTDVKYEYTSDKRFERFDFLVDNRLLIEAKKLNASLNDNIISQIEKYIKNHDFIKYGILTNGSDYVFFVKKDFIKEFLGAEEKFRVEYDNDVFRVLQISIDGEKFFEIMGEFHKNKYHETFRQIARFVLTLINKTRITKIVDDKDLNTLLQTMITQCVDVQEGEFLKDIQSGKIKVGQTLKYENDDLCIPVVVMNDGRVKLVKGSINVKNMNNVDSSEFKPIIDLARNEWKTTDVIFNDTKDIIRAAINKQRLYGTYEFK
jgi:hypothetical protein